MLDYRFATTREVISKVIMNRAMKIGVNIVFGLLLFLFLWFRSIFAGLLCIIVLIISFEFSMKEQMNSLRLEMKQGGRP